MKPIKRGTRLNTGLINSIIKQANRGALPERDDELPKSLLTEPAHEVLVMNEGTTAIAAFSPAGIVKSLGQSDGELYTERVLRVRPPKAEDAGNFVIVQDEIQPGGMAWAWCGGVCLVRLMRWFESDQLERADILAGERYALASVDGALDIIWSQRTTATVPGPIVGTEHLAVVRFNGRRFQLWKNGGTVTAPYGCPIVSKVTDTSGVVDGDRFDVLSCRVPVSADSKTLAYVNIGGDVAAGEYGRCTIGDALVRTAAAYNAGQSVGAVTALLTMSSSGSGFLVMARLGAYLGVQYAIAKVAGGSAPIYFVQIVDGQTTYSNSPTIYYGVKRKAGTFATVSSLWDPNSVGGTAGAFVAEDGIGRGILIVDGVAQAGYVLIAHDSRTGSMITFSLVTGDRVAVVTQVSIPLAADSEQSVTAYLPLYV